MLQQSLLRSTPKTVRQHDFDTEQNSRTAGSSSLKQGDKTLGPYKPPCMGQTWRVCSKREASSC